MKIKYLLSSVLLLAVLLCAVKVPAAHAQTNASVDMSLGVSPPCTTAIDGQDNANYFGVTPGYGANVSFENYSSHTITISVTQNGSQTFTKTLPPGDIGDGFTSGPITSVVSVNATPDCSSSPATLFIEPATGSISCALSGSQWNITGSFSNVASGVTVVANSTSVFNADPANPNGTYPVTFSAAASSPAETFSLYDGVKTGGKGTLLSETSCPAYTAPAATSSSGRSSGSSGTTTTTTKPTTPTPATTTTTTPKTTSTTPTQSAKSVPNVAIAPKKAPFNVVEKVVLPALLLVAALIAIGWLLVMHGFLTLSADPTKKGILKHIPLQFRKRSA